ncbi:MAG: hypothetical protein JXR96_29835 [Deltaproteobacteria bacterium]|nr:hypothetical protein [Deltaproteobacteria bacterium]
MHVQRFATLILACLLLPASLEAGELPQGDSDWSIEWFGMNLGAGPLFFDLGCGDTYGTPYTHFAVQADLMLLDFGFPRWHVTAIEIHPVFMLGYMGGGARAGATIPLFGGRQHELRLGSFAGCDYYMFDINAFHPSLSLKPYVQYVYHTSIGSLGAGVDLLLLFHFRDRMTAGDGYSFDVPPVAFGISFYFRWTVGRSVFKG